MIQTAIQITRRRLEVSKRRATGFTKSELVDRLCKLFLAKLPKQKANGPVTRLTGLLGPLSVLIFCIIYLDALIVFDELGTTKLKPACQAGWGEKRVFFRGRKTTPSF